jgi:iron complex transport system substrate-binding protein
MPELVDIAGGTDALAECHGPSCRIPWGRVIDYAPEVIVLACCGYGLARCIEEARILARFPRVEALPAVRSGRVFAADGSAYFSRPGPRIVDSLELLAHLLHPERFTAPALPNAWAAVAVEPMMRKGGPLAS